MGFLRRIGFLLAFVNGTLFAQQIVKSADQPQKYSAKFTDVTTKLDVNFQYLSSHTAKHYLGANFGDMDNDGFLDIYLGTGGPEYGFLMPKVWLRNHEGKFFVDISSSAGIGDLHKGHGTAFADLRNNGHEDIVTSMGGATPGDAHAVRVFENPGNDEYTFAL